MLAEAGIPAEISLWFTPKSAGARRRIIKRIYPQWSVNHGKMGTKYTRVEKSLVEEHKCMSLKKNSKRLEGIVTLRILRDLYPPMLVSWFSHKRRKPKHTQIITRTQTHHSVWSTRLSSQPIPPMGSRCEMSSAGDGEQDILFCWLAKKRHCMIAINWADGIVTHCGLLQFNCHCYCALFSPLVGHKDRTAHERTPAAGICHYFLEHQLWGSLCMSDMYIKVKYVTMCHISLKVILFYNTCNLHVPLHATGNHWRVSHFIFCHVHKERVSIMRWTYVKVMHVIIDSCWVTSAYPVTMLMCGMK